MAPSRSTLVHAPNFLLSILTHARFLIISSSDFPYSRDLARSLSLLPVARSVRTFHIRMLRITAFCPGESVSLSPVPLVITVVQDVCLFIFLLSSSSHTSLPGLTSVSTCLSLCQSVSLASLLPSLSSISLSFPCMQRLYSIGNVSGAAISLSPSLFFLSHKRTVAPPLPIRCSEVVFLVEGLSPSLSCDF